MALFNELTHSEDKKQHMFSLFCDISSKSLPVSICPDETTGIRKTEMNHGGKKRSWRVVLAGDRYYQGGNGRK